MELVLGLVALILVLYWLYYALDYDGLHTAEKPAPRRIEPETQAGLRRGQISGESARFVMDNAPERAFPR
ncbi:MAG: hypothetical protein ACFB6R_06910 [Alphaproteobacteria bacterium]